MPDKRAAIASIVDNIRRVFQVVNEQSKKAELATGLTGPQLWTIKVIAENGPIKVSDLAHRLYLHPATVVGILDRLEKHGIALRTRSQDDRRVVKVDLTESGRTLLSGAPEVAQGLLVDGLEKLPEERLHNIAAGLGQLVEILGAQKLPPQLLLSSEMNAPRRRKPRQPKPMQGDVKSI